MGNTLSKLLIGSVISISLTSNGINAKQNEFDRTSFEKAWKEFLRQQAIERGLDVSKYRYRSSSRSILSDSNPSSPEVQAAIETARLYNEQLYEGIQKGYTFKGTSTALFTAFKSVSQKWKDPDGKTQLRYNEKFVDLKSNNPPNIETAELLALLAKIIWTKGKSKGVFQQYNQFAHIVISHFGNPIVDSAKFAALSPEHRTIYGQFFFGKAQIDYSSDRYPDAISSVDTAVSIAEMADIKDMKLKYRSLETKARALRELGSDDELIESMELSKKIYEESGQDWVKAQAQNNKGVLFKRYDFNVSVAEKGAIAKESEDLRIKLGDKQGVSSSNGNKGKAMIKDHGNFGEAFRLQELSRDWRVANADTWGVAGSDFTDGKVLLELNQRHYSSPIFYGMAIRLFTRGLKGFRVVGAPLGECEVSEYFAILLTEIGEYDDAKTVAKLNFFFRKLVSPGKLEADIGPSLHKLGYISQEQSQILASDQTSAKEQIVHGLGQTYLTPEQKEIVQGDQNEKDEEKRRGVKILFDLLEKHKNYGINTAKNSNYLKVWEAHERVRDEHLKGANIIDLNYIDLRMGRLYLELADTKHIDAVDSKQTHIGNNMLEMLGALKFLNILTYQARMIPIDIVPTGIRDEDTQAIILGIEKSVEYYGLPSAKKGVLNQNAELQKALDDFVKCRSDCFQKKEYPQECGCGKTASL